MPFLDFTDRIHLNMLELVCFVKFLKKEYWCKKTYTFAYESMILNELKNIKVLKIYFEFLCSESSTFIFIFTVFRYLVVLYGYLYITILRLF